MRVWPIVLVACSEQSLKALNADPSASILTPEDGAELPVGGEVTVRGAASDPDDGPGELEATWYVDEVEVCRSAPADDASTTCGFVLQRDTPVRLEVVDPRGAAASDTIVLLAVVEEVPDPEAPSVSMVAPAWGDVVLEGDAVLFSATASDPDGAVGALAWVWSSDLDGVFSTVPGDDAGAAQFVDDGRTVGVHTITVEVTDPGGLVARDVSLLEVRAAVDGPTAPGVEIVPADPLTDDPLTATISAPSVDPGGGEVSYTWSWTLDGALVPELTSDTVDPSWTVRGDLWAATATPTAGGRTGPGGTDAVTIGNTLPTEPGVGIEPASPVAGDALQCVVVVPSEDADGDPVGYAFAWDVDGAAFVGATDGVWPGDTVPDGEGAEGERWTCTVTPDDGVGAGPDGAATVTIGASTPTDCPDPSCALRFDGVDDYVEVPHAASLDGGASAITVEAWVYYDRVDGNCMTAVRKGTASSPTYDYWLHKNWSPADSSFWGSWTGYTVLGWGVFGSGRWIHYAGVYDPSVGMARAFVDGVEVGSGAAHGTPTPNTDVLRIGIDWDFGCAMDGVIDEVRISRAVRYTGPFVPATTLPVDATTVALWRFEEYTGTTAYDSSGNGNHGTVHGAIWTTESP